MVVALVFNIDFSVSDDANASGSRDVEMVTCLLTVQKTKAPPAKFRRDLGWISS